MIALLGIPINDKDRFEWEICRKKKKINREKKTIMKIFLIEKIVGNIGPRS